MTEGLWRNICTPAFAMEVRHVPAVIERYVKAGPDVQAKLAASRAGAESKRLRTDHYYIRVKCRKCKFDETIDTALFRTIRHRRRKSMRWKLATVRRGMKWKSSV